MVENIMGKEKMLDTCIFFYSHNVSVMDVKSHHVCGKGLT